jgi:hypothetical protein
MKSWKRAYGMYATSMDFLFEPSWPSSLTHTKSTLENGGLVGFWTCILWFWELDPCLWPSWKCLQYSIRTINMKKVDCMVYTWSLLNKWMLKKNL